MTYRLGGHSFGSTTEYMDADELARAEAAEPLGRARQWLLDDLGVDQATLDAIEREVADEVEVAVAFAEAAEPPSGIANCSPTSSPPWRPLPR